MAAKESHLAEGEELVDLAILFEEFADRLAGHSSNFGFGEGSAQIGEDGGCHHQVTHPVRHAHNDISRRRLADIPHSTDINFDGGFYWRSRFPAIQKPVGSSRSDGVQQKSPSRIILGIDPGTRVTGYGVISCSHGAAHGTATPLDFGCIRTDEKAELPQRFLTIFDGLLSLISRFSPEAISVETQFFAKNAKSALAIGMARGVVLLAAAKSGVPIYQYAPSQAKLAVVGSGKASKDQVQRMIQMLLRLRELPQPDDAADALALALCHLHRTTSCTNSFAAH